jgi:hypothetical protein
MFESGQIRTSQSRSRQVAPTVETWKIAAEIIGVTTLQSDKVWRRELVMLIRRVPRLLLCFSSLVIGATGLTMLGTGIAPAQTSDCNPKNGCIGHLNGMRAFSANPTVSGVIVYNELFIDRGTKTYNGQACGHGVIRLGQNTNRIFDPTAVRDTPRQPGADRGRPIQGCAP